MRFNLVVNLERLDPGTDMTEVLHHTTGMVQLADEAGFDIVWAAEHHALEMTIAPGPFQLLAHFAAHTDRIRLGTAVAVAPYWHPIRLAGEAALLDLLSGGRLEFGIGKGAYRREFDRMAGGMEPSEGVPMMWEMLPLLKSLWAGDVASDGEYWQFPESTSCPKPLQRPHPPIWVAARDPGTFEGAVRNGCDIMSWAKTAPFEEVENLIGHFEAALGANPGAPRPRFMTMRHVGIYEKPDEADVFIRAIQNQGAVFESLVRKLTPVIDGFPQPAAPEQLVNGAEYEPERLLANLILGTPAQAIDKLRRYEAAGFDHFCYMASYGLPMREQRRSLELFANEVMPAFQDKGAAA